MLKLLLDEHISPAVAAGLRRIHPHLAVWPLSELLFGSYLGQADEAILSMAEGQKLTLVTFDQKTIRPLAMDWAHDNRPHEGIIFVDEKTIAPGNIGGLVRALTEVIEERAHDDWTNRIIFLKR